MRKCVAFILFALLLSDACAKVVRSCDGRYSAQILGPSELVVKRGGRKVGIVKIDHHIEGGAFSLDGRSLIVYGMPNKVDLRGPQATFISIYILKPTLRAIMKRTYGGGIYDVAIGSDQKSIFVSSRFGFDVIDIRNMKISSFDPISEPQFSRQKCKFGD
ncbi:hypothetical protein [Burkholderia sp. Bp9142]|uniref:hypothetical protein n=1 Tax=Burkholderia sp. Bp9142 TaxID=2184573 RepID=UPI000F5924FC|nr:hypothetical protein [Burkholderia sp. Bp9142]